MGIMVAVFSLIAIYQEKQKQSDCIFAAIDPFSGRKDNAGDLLFPLSEMT